MRTPSCVRRVAGVAAFTIMTVCGAFALCLLGTGQAFAIPSPELPAIAENPQPAPEPAAARKEFVEISVLLTIEDGRVAGAQIGNRQPGAEAFEATALHIARQRRYPPGTSRTETLVVRVANQFGRKEP